VVFSAHHGTRHCVSDAKRAHAPETWTAAVPEAHAMPTLNRSTALEESGTEARAGSADWSGGERRVSNSLLSPHSLVGTCDVVASDGCHETEMEVLVKGGA
jgi:hypothetical protein